jgi:transcriptional antiterminator NusG
VPLFPEYVFLRAERVDETSWHSLRTLPGFIRFLPASDRILPLDNRDQATLLHFLSFGEVVEKSVDRRKGRARVRLEIYQDSFVIDFGFEALEPIDGGMAKT